MSTRTIGRGALSHLDLDALVRLLTDLNQEREISPSVQSWRDDQNLYIEADLPELDEAYFDICVFSGRVLVRISR